MANAAKNPNGERDALIDAVVAETVERGYGELSVEGIAARAGLPASSFSASFSDLRAAVVTAHQVLFERYFRRLVRACEAQPSWPLKVKVGIGMTLDLAAASPVRARFLIEEPAAVDPVLARQAMECQDRLARLLAPGRVEAQRGPGLPGITEHALVAGVAGVISGRLIKGESQHLPALAPELVELTLSPYLGAEAAAAVARRPPPQISEL